MSSRPALLVRSVLEMLFCCCNTEHVTAVIPPYHVSRVTHSVPYARVPVLQPHALDAEAAVAASGVAHVPVYAACNSFLTLFALTHWRQPWKPSLSSLAALGRDLGSGQESSPSSGWRARYSELLSNNNYNYTLHNF